MTEPVLARVPAGSRLSFLTGAALFLTLALGLVLGEAINIGAAALFLLALGWLAFHGHWRRHDLHRLEWLLLLAPAAFALAWLLAWTLHGQPAAGESIAERMPKFLAIAPIYLYLRRVDGLEGAWWNGLVAGCLIAGGYALWYAMTGRVGEYGARVPGPITPLYLGGFAMAYALMLIPRLADDRQSGWARALAGVAIVLAFVVNGLSGSRGAWLAIPALLAVYLFTAGAGQPTRWRFGIPLIVLLTSLVVLLTPALPITDRLDETVTDLRLIAEGSNGTGGLGERLQLWEIAGGVIAEHPLGGAGSGSFRQAVLESVEAGSVDESLRPYDHPHSQYLSALIEGGIGLLVLLVTMFASPVLLVATLSRQCSRQCRYLAWCALASGVVYATMALSESLFVRNAGVTWFIFLTATATALAVGSRHSRAGAGGSLRNDSSPAFGGDSGLT